MYMESYNLQHTVYNISMMLLDFKTILSSSNIVLKFGSQDYSLDLG